MSGSETPGSPPPEVPEEFLDAYNEAYRRALEPDGLAQGLIPEVEPQEVVAVGTHRPDYVASAEEDDAEDDAEDDQRADVDREAAARPGWVVHAALAGGALLLVLGAYGVGKLVSDDTPAPAPTASTGPAKPKPSTSKHPGKPQSSPAGAPWDGKVAAVAPTAARATCTARPGVDSSGRPVRYRAANTLDGDPTTAWRCDGTGVGARLRFTLPSGTEVAEVGLIPGYAKTDPASGTDRYAENNRITRVRWTFDDGTSVVQTLDPDPSKRDVQTLRVPPVKTGELDLEILAVTRGPRNTTAISEATFGVAQR